MQPRSIPETISDSNRLGMQFLITDCRTALTFLDLAETTAQPEDRARRIEEARQSYGTILHLFRQLSPTESEAEELNTELAELKRRLQQAGVSM
jgi:hypothetical protein